MVELLRYGSVRFATTSQANPPLCVSSRQAKQRVRIIMLLFDIHRPLPRVYAYTPRFGDFDPPTHQPTRSFRIPLLFLSLQNSCHIHNVHVHVHKYLILSRSPNCMSNLRRSSSMISCCFSARSPLPSSPSPRPSSTLRAHSSRSLSWLFSLSISSERLCC